MRKYFKIVFNIFIIWLFIGCVLFGVFFFMFDSIRTGSFWNDLRENFLLYYLPAWFIVFLILGTVTLVLYFVFKRIDKSKGNSDWEKQHFAEVRKKNSRQYDRMYAEWQRIQGNSPDPEPEREVDPNEIYDIEKPDKFDSREEPDCLGEDDVLIEDDDWYNKN